MTQRTIEDATLDEFLLAMRWHFDNKVERMSASAKTWKDLDEGDRHLIYKKLVYSDGSFSMHYGHETVGELRNGNSRSTTDHTDHVVEIGDLEALKASPYWALVASVYKRHFRDLSCLQDMEIVQEDKCVSMRLPIFPYTRDILSNRTPAKRAETIEFTCDFVDEDHLSLSIGGIALCGSFWEIHRKLKILEAVERAGIEFDEDSESLTIPTRREVKDEQEI